MAASHISRNKKWRCRTKMCNYDPFRRMVPFVDHFYSIDHKHLPSISCRCTFSSRHNNTAKYFVLTLILIPIMITAGHRYCHFHPSSVAAFADAGDLCSLLLLSLSSTLLRLVSARFTTTPPPPLTRSCFVLTNGIDDSIGVCCICDSILFS